MQPTFEQIEIQKAADEFASLDWVRETSTYPNQNEHYRTYPQIRTRGLHGCSGRFLTRDTKLPVLFAL
jgi:hypothetical protein